VTARSAFQSRSSLRTRAALGHFPRAALDRRGDAGEAAETCRGPPRSELHDVFDDVFESKNDTAVPGRRAPDR
jgi:hypothetical protein